jgi:copper chaperone CopZ
MKLPVSEDARLRMERQWSETGIPRKAKPQSRPSRAQADEQQTITLAISGMTRHDCAVNVERALEGVSGVVRVYASYELGQALVSVDAEAPPDAAALIEAVRKAGYASTVER